VNEPRSRSSAWVAFVSAHSSGAQIGGGILNPGRIDYCTRDSAADWGDETLADYAPMFEEMFCFIGCRFLKMVLRIR